MSYETLQNFCQVGVVVFAILTALASFGSNHFGKNVATTRAQKLDSQIEGLKTQNGQLLSEVKQYKVDLTEKEKKIAELERKAKKAERGIVSAYSFNGAKRMLRAGNIQVVAGQECTSFQEMKELENSKKYEDLILLCNKQIDAVPEWLTPYLFRGIAYENLGRREDAIKDLRHIAESAPDDPEYTQAQELLDKLGK